MRARRTEGQRAGRVADGALALVVALLGVVLLGAAGRARGEGRACDALASGISARLERCGAGPAEPLAGAVTPACRDAVRDRLDTWTPALLVRLLEAPGCPRGDAATRADAFQALCQLRPPQPEHVGPMRQALTQPGTSPAVTASVVACFRALVEDPRSTDGTTAGDFLRRLPPDSHLIAPLRDALIASLREQPARRGLIRWEARLHQLLCRPAPASPELAPACADAEPWHQPPGACPAIGALLARPDVRAGQCDPVLGRNVQLPYDCRQAVRAGRAPEVQQLVSILQSPFASHEECRALGLEVLCALRPELAVPVLSQWRERTHGGGIETTAQCLVALRQAQGEAAAPFLHDFFFKPYPPEAVLVELLRRTDPPQREALAPLLDALDKDSTYREHGYRLFCTKLLSPENIAKCNAERERVAKQREAEAERKRDQQQGSRRDRNVRLGRALGITAVSVALAGLHVGLSVRYRDDERNFGGFYAYQGALAGGMLAAGVGVAIASTRKPFGLGTLAAALIGVPLAGVLGAVGGGIAGYKIGEPPGDGRIITGVISQSIILGSVLGLTWRFSR